MASTFQLYSAGPELKASLLALSRVSVSEPEAGLSSPASPAPGGGSGARPGAAGEWGVPPHLLRLPALREAAVVAQQCCQEARAAHGEFEPVYSYALALQELASRVQQSPSDQFALLQQACDVYNAACQLQQGRHAASLYNWSVALSDIARIVRAQQPEEALECLQAAATKYVQSLAVNPRNPQALNNLGLVLQDLSSLRPPEQRSTYLRHSVAKFRQAVRLHPSFDRACYNLGTVVYAHACTLQEELLERQERREAALLLGGASGGRGGGELSAPSSGSGRAAAEAAVRATYAHAAQFIALSYALQPARQVYADSLAAVQRLLPLPHLRAGPLLAVHPATLDTPAEAWAPCWFGLDHARLHAIRPPSAEAAAGLAAPLPISYDVSDMLGVRLASDVSLPAGYAIWLQLRSRPRGVYLVTQDREDAEGWVDALVILRHLAQAGRGGLEALQRALSVRR